MSFKNLKKLQVELHTKKSSLTYHKWDGMLSNENKLVELPDELPRGKN